jgi:hypothetical protein
MSKFDAKCAHKIVEFCKQKSGKVTVAELVALLGSERNARYGLSQIRAAKLAFEPLREGRKVVSYTMVSTDFSTVTDALALAGTTGSKTPKAKVAKAPKAKATVKDIHAEANALIDKAVKSGRVKPMPAAKVKSAKVAAETSVRAINKAHAAKAKPVIDQTRVSDEAKALAKAKNLETMKKVSASAKKHPVTKQAMTQTQEEVLEEFARLELAAQDDPREYMPAFLLKESYKE